MTDPGLRGFVKNGLWTIGGKNKSSEMLTSISSYTLKDVHDKVRSHVLVFLGENDIYVKDPHQYEIMKNAFKNAASYTFKVFKEEYGSAEHCQVGSVEQKAQLVTNWLETIRRK